MCVCVSSCKIKFTNYSLTHIYVFKNIMYVRKIKSTNSSHTQWYMYVCEWGNYFYTDTRTYTQTSVYVCVFSQFITYGAELCTVLCIVSEALLTKESNKRRKLQRISCGCGLNSRMRLNYWQYTRDSDDKSSLLGRAPPRMMSSEVICLWYQRSWSKRAFKSEDVASWLTWRGMRSVKSTCTRHATHEHLGFP